MAVIATVPPIGKFTPGGSLPIVLATGTTVTVEQKAAILVKAEAAGIQVVDYAGPGIANPDAYKFIMTDDEQPSGLVFTWGQGAYDSRDPSTWKGRLTASDESGLVVSAWDDGWVTVAALGSDAAFFPGAVAADKYYCGVGIPAFSANIAPAADVGIILVTLTGNTTIAVPASGASPGQELTFILKQDATGGRVVTFAAGYKKSAVLPTVASTHNVITFITADGTTWMQKSASLGNPN